jgi:acyl carrier protein
MKKEIKKNLLSILIKLHPNLKNKSNSFLLNYPLDSLDFLSISFELEKKFKVKINAKYFTSFISISKILKKYD